jgi:hypothetical protein
MGSRSHGGTRTVTVVREISGESRNKKRRIHKWRIYNKCGILLFDLLRRRSESDLGTDSEVGFMVGAVQ